MSSFGNTKNINKTFPKKGKYMPKTTKVPVVETVSAEPAVHPLKKSYRFISSKHVDYGNLTAIESVAMSLALVLAVTNGVIISVLQKA